jgi:hypothetical protein
MTFLIYDSLKKASLAGVRAAWRPIEISRLNGVGKLLKVQCNQDTASHIIPELCVASHVEDELR